MKVKKHRIYLLVCLYDGERAKVCQQIIRLFKKTLDHYDVISIAIYNGSKDVNWDHECAYFIQGSNEHAEFSAWQEGLDYLRSNYSIEPSAKFVFFNDTLFHHYFPNIVGWVSFFKTIISDENRAPKISGSW